MSTPDDPTARLKTAELIGGLFLKARKASGLTQKEITARTGLVRSAQHYIEKGMRKNAGDEMLPVDPGTGTLARLAILYKMSDEDLADLARWGRPDVRRGVHAIKLGLDPDNPHTYVVLDFLAAQRARLGSGPAYLDWVARATEGYPPGVTVGVFPPRGCESIRARVDTGHQQDHQ